jgi:hypothetical protein
MARLDGLGKLKNFNDHSGTGTRDFPACRIGPTLPLRRTVVTLLTCIRKASIWNPGCDTQNYNSLPVGTFQNITLH